MSKKRIPLIIFLIFLAIAAFNNLQSPPKNETTDVLPEKTENIPAENLVKVTKVIDGDTIEIGTGQKVRLIGIDTPETVDPRRPDGCFGKQASDKTREILEGQMVRLEKDVSETDRFGRLLRYIYKDDIFINKLLVEEGFAHAISYPPDIKHQEILKEAERQARENNRGLWNVCPLSFYIPPSRNILYANT